MVRSVWPAERADRVIGCEAWPALAYKLGQLGQQGHDVEALLRSVPAFVDRAHTPAAFTFRVIDDRVAGRIDLGSRDSTGSEVVERRTVERRTLDLSRLDPDVARAATLVVDTQFASAHMLQRRLGIGFSEAGHLMDQLEQAGVVSSDGGSGRQVLLTRQDLTGRQHSHVAAAARAFPRPTIDAMTASTFAHPAEPATPVGRDDIGRETTER